MITVIELPYMNRLSLSQTLTRTEQPFCVMTPQQVVATPNQLAKSKLIICCPNDLIALGRVRNIGAVPILLISDTATFGAQVSKYAGVLKIVGRLDKACDEDPDALYLGIKRYVDDHLGRHTPTQVATPAVK